MDLGFWKDRTVLVSGHTGFKGSWLASWLKALGARVVGFALPPPTEPNMFTEASVADGMTSVQGDVRDFAAVRAVIDTYRPEVLFHMAAQALVRVSYAHPVETYNTNVMGTVHLLQAMAEQPAVRAAVMVTSDKCYDNHEWHWGYREIDPMGGADPYSSSKACAELVTAAYRRSFFASVRENAQAQSSAQIASARAGNVIGGGDWAEDRLVPDIIRAFSANQQATVRYPRAIRPWQHVLEPLRGYLMLAEALWKEGGTVSGAWNFGPDDDDVQPVAKIADRLASLWGQEAGWQTDNEVNPHEATFLKLDCSKARAELGWRPLLDLDRALQWSVEWYRAHVGRQDTREITSAQIRQYQDLVRAAG